MHYSMIRRKTSRLLRSIKFIFNHPISQRDRLSALKRYAQFHIFAPFLPGPVIYPFIENIRFAASIGMAGVVGNIYTGLDDFEAMGFLCHFLRNEDCFVDVGANVGAYTLLASGVCKAQTIAIEPIPSTFENLMLNLRINDLTNFVTPLNIGAGSSKQNLHFTYKFDVLNKVVLDIKSYELDEVIQVDVLPLDLLLENKQPALIKIDVEGYEHEVMIGATTILSDIRLKALIIEMHGHENRYKEGYDAVHRMLLSCDFHPYSYNPFNRNLERLSDFNHSKFNTLYLRDIDFVVNRIKTSRKYKIFNVSF